MPASIFSSGFRAAGSENGIEPVILRTLTRQAGIQVDRLVVRQTPAGVCLDGVVRFPHGHVDITQLVRTATGLSEVLNRLVVCEQDCAADLTTPVPAHYEYSGHG
jgi:hypothetical protein